MKCSGLFCNGMLVPVGQQKKNFSVGKAVGGGLILGPVGIAAGLLGKSGKHQAVCMKCGKVHKI